MRNLTTRNEGRDTGCRPAHPPLAPELPNARAVFFMLLILFCFHFTSGFRVLFVKYPLPLMGNKHKPPLVEAGCATHKKIKRFTFFCLTSAQRLGHEQQGTLVTPAPPLCAHAAAKGCCQRKPAQRSFPFFSLVSVVLQQERGTLVTPARPPVGVGWLHAPETFFLQT